MKPEFSGHSHSFDTGIADHYGVNVAIIYNHIVYLQGYLYLSFDDQDTLKLSCVYISDEEIDDAIDTLFRNGFIEEVEK